MEGYALLCQYVPLKLQIFVSFTLKMNDHDFGNSTIVVPEVFVRLVFTKVSLENAKSQKNRHGV